MAGEWQYDSAAGANQGKILRTSDDIAYECCCFGAGWCPCEEADPAITITIAGDCEAVCADAASAEGAYSWIAGWSDPPTGCMYVWQGGVDDLWNLGLFWCKEQDTWGASLIGPGSFGKDADDCDCYPDMTKVAVTCNEGALTANFNLAGDEETCAGCTATVGLA